MMAGEEYGLAGGRAVVLRPAGPGDFPAIARLYGELSEDSFRSRFQSGVPVPELVAKLARFGPPPGAGSVVAAAAGDPGHLVGEARYVSLGERAAELGLTVLDGYQGAGLGRLLLAALVHHARDGGAERLRAVVSLANGPMLHLLEHYGWVLAGSADGYSVAVLEISTDGGMPGWPVSPPGRRVLVERRGWFDDDRVAALRSAGNTVRVCAGPRRESGRRCPLLVAGRCRLAEEADLIVPLLPAGDADCAAVVAAHRRRWPGRLALPA